MNARKSRAVALQVRRFLGNYVRANVLGRQHLRPYLALYYTTYHCNMHCAFCSRKKELDGELVPEVSLDQMRETLVQVRKITPTLYVTGGEPLVLSDIEERLEVAHDLGFYPIIMNTAGALLHRHMGVLRLLDTLVVSLHTVDPAKLAEIYRTPVKQGRRILDNIVEVSRLAKKPGHASVMANCVLTPDNILTAHHVLDFCVERGIELAVVPAIESQQPTIQTAGIIELSAYYRLMERVIEQKRKDPKSIQGTLTYLEHLRSFRRVACRPTAVLPISPSGEVLHPCDLNFKPIGRLNRDTTVLSVLSDRLDLYKSFQSCPDNCLKACYAQTASMLEDIPETLWEFLSKYL